MFDVWSRIAASLICSTLFCVATVHSVGALQQGGYKNSVYLRWLRKKENLTFNRLWVWALCLALATAVTALCFSFLGTTGALACSSLPFFLLCGLFLLADRKFALKVPVKRTPRLQRLFVAYWFITAVFCYVFIAFLLFLAKWNGSDLYALIAYVPFCVTPMLLPILLCAANAVMCVFEDAHNKKFIRKAGQVLDETDIVRVAVVGSYGKTSVKNILHALLSVKYGVVATPASYNTPMGVALTICSRDFAEKQVFIAEMGARKTGDVRELCRLIKPQYAVFTGVCEQHVDTFGCLENVWAEKSVILRQGAQVVCGKTIKPFLTTSDSAEGVCFAEDTLWKELRFQATKTEGVLCVDGREIAVSVPLLGEPAAENIALAVTLALKMGLTAEEIERGLRNVTAVEHRLQCIENNGVYVLDDGYNCNPAGAREALHALSRFSGRKCVVTPGIVECGVLEGKLNGELGQEIASLAPDLVILVGETLVLAVKNGYLSFGGEEGKLRTVKTLSDAQAVLAEWIQTGDAVLFLNDLPDVY